jgi:hypothetical protein
VGVSNRPFCVAASLLILIYLIPINLLPDIENRGRVGGINCQCRPRADKQTDLVIWVIDKSSILSLGKRIRLFSERSVTRVQDRSRLASSERPRPSYAIGRVRCAMNESSILVLYKIRVCNEAILAIPLTISVVRVLNDRFK